MQALGVSAEAVEDLRDQEEDEADQDKFLVYPCNWATVQAFRHLEDAWTVVPTMTGLFYQGIPPTECESVFRLMQIQDSDKLEILDGIRVMASAARKVMNREQ